MWLQFAHKLELVLTNSLTYTLIFKKTYLFIVDFFFFSEAFN